MNCPASIQMGDQIERVEEGSNFFAEEGTAAHELGELCLRNECIAEGYIGSVFNGIEVDSEMAHQVQKYVDYVTSCETWESQLLIECRVPITHVEETMFGTADAVIFDNDGIEIIDLKYGRGIVVEPYDNPQLMLYACGVLAHLAKYGVRFDPDKEVKLTIVQPRAPHKDGPVRSSYVTVAQLKDFQRIARRATELSKEEMPPFGPSDETCRWCPANAICSEFADYQLQQMRLEFADFQSPRREFGERLIDVKSMTNDQLANILNHSKGITQWLKTIADYATAQLSQGKEVPHYKLVYGRSIRRLDNPTEVERKLLDYGVDEKRLYISKFRTAPQLEKELRPEEWDLIVDHVVKPRGSITLAPESDGRPAVDPNVEAKKEWEDG